MIKFILIILKLILVLVFFLIIFQCIKNKSKIKINNILIDDNFDYSSKLVLYISLFLFILHIIISLY